MSAIGTSQESAQPEVIQAIGIRNKILGVDIQHIGDAIMDLVSIENIKELSDAIRGKDILLLEWLVRLIVKKSEQRHEFRKFEFVSYDFLLKNGI